MNDGKFFSYNIFNPSSKELEGIANYIIDNNILILPLRLRRNQELFLILLEKRYIMLFDMNFEFEEFKNVDINIIASYIIHLRYQQLPSFINDNVSLINKLLQDGYYFALDFIYDNKELYEKVNKDDLASYIYSHYENGITFDNLSNDTLLCKKLIELGYKSLFRCNFSNSVYEEIGIDNLIEFIENNKISSDLPDFILNNFDYLLKLIKTPDISFNLRNSIISDIFKSGNISDIVNLIKSTAMTKFPFNYYDSEELLTELLRNGYEGSFLCDFSPTLFTKIDKNVICDYIISTGATFVPDTLGKDEELFRMLLDRKYLGIFKFELNTDICKNIQEELIKLFLDNDIHERIDNSIEYVIFQNPIFLKQENIPKLAKYLINSNIKFLSPSWCFRNSLLLFNYLYDMDIDYLLSMTFDGALFEEIPIEKLQDYYRRHPQELSVTLSYEKKLAITSHQMKKVDYLVVSQILLEQNRNLASAYIKKYSGLSLELSRSLKNNGLEATFNEFGDAISSIQLVLNCSREKLYRLFADYIDDPKNNEENIIMLVREFCSKLKEKYAAELTRKQLLDIRDNYTVKDNENDKKNAKKNKRLYMYLEDVKRLFKHDADNNYLIIKLKELGLLDLDIDPELLITKILLGEEIIEKRPQSVEKHIKYKALNRLKSNYSRSLSFIINDNIIYVNMIIDFLNGKVEKDDIRKIVGLGDFITLNDIKDVCDEAEATVRYENGKVIFDVSYVLTKEDIEYSKRHEEMLKKIKKMKSFLYMDMNECYPLESISLNDEDTKIYVPNGNNNSKLYLDINKIKNARFETMMKLLLIRDTYPEDKSKKVFDKLFIDGGIIYAVPFLDENMLKQLIRVANNMSIVCDNFRENDININNINNIIKKVMVVQYASPSDIAILGEEVITKIAYSDTFIYSRGDDNRQKRIGLAARYAALANKKMASTIPYFSVDVDGFTVSRYSSCEPDVLACGIDTDSCFRIFGNDNDFLLYTLFNKNGIVIKITDEFGNLVGRSSGFRNGNVLYFNQARTIYDTHGSPTKETNEVMQKYHKALEVFAKKIISLTADSSQPIEHVIVLKTYGYNEVDGATYIEKEMIPYIPMNIKGKDYQEFLDDPDLSLSSANNKEGFTTDYQGAVYDAVVLASAPGKEIQSKSDIIGYDASAIYYRPRKKVMVYKKGQIDFEVVNSINRIIAKNIYWGNNDIRNEKKKNFKLIKSLEDIELVILGEDYYFMMDSFGNTHELCLPYDKRAISEFEEVKKAVIGNYRTLR